MNKPPEIGAKLSSMYVAPVEVTLFPSHCDVEKPIMLWHIVCQFPGTFRCDGAKCRSYPALHRRQGPLNWLERRRWCHRVDDGVSVSRHASSQRTSSQRTWKSGRRGSTAPAHIDCPIHPGRAGGLPRTVRARGRARSRRRTDRCGWATVGWDGTRCPFLRRRPDRDARTGGRSASSWSGLTPQLRLVCMLDVRGNDQGRRSAPGVVVVIAVPGRGASEPFAPAIGDSTAATGVGILLQQESSAVAARIRQSRNFFIVWIPSSRRKSGALASNPETLRSNRSAVGETTKRGCASGHVRRRSSGSRFGGAGTAVRGA